MDDIAYWNTEGTTRRVVEDENGLQVEELDDGWWMKIADARRDRRADR